MPRKPLTILTKHKADHIRWRSHEVTRIEAFSDAVFAFAITLLIISLEVPKSSEELLRNMRGFIPFSLCFGLLFVIWNNQHRFFRRFGLQDNFTLALNAMLLFVVLFYVYPLKFMVSGMLLRNVVFTNKPGELRNLMLIYNGGFAAIYTLFSLMYFNALQKREHLQLTPKEVYSTKNTLYMNMVLAAVGIAATATAALGDGPATVCCIAYAFIGPATAIIMAKRKKIGKMFDEEHKLAAIPHHVPETEALN